MVSFSYFEITIRRRILKMKIYVVSFLFLLTNLCFSQENEERESEREKDSLNYEIEELTITGTRTMKKIIDIPYSVFRVDKKELSYGKKVSAKDLLQDVPGLFLQNRYGNHDLRISIRGFGTRSNSGVRGIRILQDGVPESEADGETIIDAVDFTSLGGVEVVKGNMSSLYANAPGGVINFMSDLYFPKNFVALTNQFGKFDFRQNGFRMGIKTDNFRYTLSYNYRNIAGYRSHSNEYQHLVNSVFEGYIGKRATISVLGNYVNGINKLPGSLTESQYDSASFQPLNYAISQDFKRITEKGRLGVRFKTFFGKGETNEIEVTGFGGIKELEKTDQDYYYVLTRYNIGSFLRYTNRSRLFKRDNDFTIGFDYAFQAGPQSQFYNINGVKDFTLLTDIENDIGNVGIYFQNQFNLVKNKIDIYFAGRYDKFIYTGKSLQFTGVVDTTRLFNQFTPKVALNYKITKSIAVYSSYGLGFDVPALNEISNYLTSSNNGKTILNPDINAQKSNNFEFGIKGNILNFKTEFMRKLFFDVTYFNYQIKDEIVPFFLSNQTYFRNAARTSRNGLELGLKSEPFEGIELTTNYIYTNFKYIDYKAKIFNPIDSFTIQDYSNNYVPAVPHNIFNFILNYEYEISKYFNGLLQFDCDYVTKMYPNDANSESTGAYFYGNAMAGINASIKGLSIVAFIGSTNMFNRKYIGFVNTNDFFKRYYEAGEPRNIYGGINLSYAF